MFSSCWKWKEHINISRLLITKERGKVLRIFSPFAFFIAVPERMGQFFFLQGANFPPAVDDFKNQTQEDFK